MGVRVHLPSPPSALPQSRERGVEITAPPVKRAAAERVQDALLLRRTEAIANAGRRIQGGIDNGELPSDTDAQDLANFYATIYQGMSMQAKDGATHESLMATVRTAMRSWPRA